MVEEDKAWGRRDIQEHEDEWEWGVDIYTARKVFKTVCCRYN